MWRPVGVPTDTHTFEIKGGKKIFHEDGNKQGAWVAVFISDKIDFKLKSATRDKEGHCIMVRGQFVRRL